MNKEMIELLEEFGIKNKKELNEALEVLDISIFTRTPKSMRIQSVNSDCTDDREVG